jgi:hypothetical protein
MEPADGDGRIVRGALCGAPVSLARVGAACRTVRKVGWCGRRDDRPQLTRQVVTTTIGSQWEWFSAL